MGSPIFFRAHTVHTLAQQKAKQQTHTHKKKTSQTTARSTTKKRSKKHNNQHIPPQIHKKDITAQQKTRSRTAQQQAKKESNHTTTSIPKASQATQKAKQKHQQSKKAQTAKPKTLNLKQPHLSTTLQYVGQRVSEKSVCDRVGSWPCLEILLAPNTFLWKLNMSQGARILMQLSLS